MLYLILKTKFFFDSNQVWQNLALNHIMCSITKKMSIFEHSKEKIQNMHVDDHVRQAK